MEVLFDRNLFNRSNSISSRNITKKMCWNSDVLIVITGASINLYGTLSGNRSKLYIQFLSTPW